MRALLITTMLLATASADTTPPQARAQRPAAPRPCSAAYQPVEAAIAQYCRVQHKKHLRGECDRLLVESHQHRCRYLRTKWNGDLLEVTEELSDVWAFAHLRFADGAWTVVAIE
jgi:hypothetical protein